MAEQQNMADELAEQTRWANIHFKTIGDMLDVLGIAHDGIQYEKVIDAVRKHRAKSTTLADELAEAKRLLQACADVFIPGNSPDEQSHAENVVMDCVRAFLTRPAPAPDKGEVERLREACIQLRSEAIYYANRGVLMDAGSIVKSLDAALTPTPDAAEKPSRADALQAAIDNAGLDVSVCSECGRVVACIPDGMPMCEKCATAEAGQKGGE